MHQKKLFFVGALFIGIIGASAFCCSDEGDSCIRFAAIADYGRGGMAEEAVAALIDSKNPDCIVTAGDNNYPVGGYDTIDEHIGRFFQRYIFPYHGKYGPGAEENRFFPSLGNHDLMTDGGNPYFDYFSLPNNERYYDFMWWPVHFFVLNSNPEEPDGVYSTSRQADWLRNNISSSNAPWKIVYFHHAPYSSGAVHGSSTRMRWDFDAMGVNAVFSGHDHAYERVHVSSVVYFIVGACDEYLYDFVEPVEGSTVRYNDTPGVMMVYACEKSLKFQFIAIDGKLVDDVTIEK